MSPGKGVMGVRVSIALTSALYRRCTPRRKRSIPMIFAGCTDGEVIDVSAMDIKPWP